MTRLSVVLVLLVGCGDDSGGGTRHDAAVVSDARVDATVVDAAPDAQQFVNTVTCPATPNAEIGVTSGAFVQPQTTITQNQIIRFTMDQFHTAKPALTGTTDPGISVNQSQVKCLQFTATGTFNFRCSIHGFTGSVIVN